MATIEERLYLGDRAKEALENEAYIQAFDLIKSEVLQQWADSPARDTEGREKLWLMQSLLNKLQQTLKTTMETGKLASLELEHKRTLSQRVKDAMS